MSEAILIARKLDDGMYVSIEQVNKLKAKLEAENESLKAKLEDTRAAVALNHLDAGMRERRLKRALWLARAEHAADKARIFYFAATCGVLLNIDGYSNREKGRQRLDTVMNWEHVWLKVERKCRAKAEEYK